VTERGRGRARARSASRRSGARVRALSRRWQDARRDRRPQRREARRNVEDLRRRRGVSPRGRHDSLEIRFGVTARACNGSSARRCSRSTSRRCRCPRNSPVSRPSRGPRRTVATTTASTSSAYLRVSRRRIRSCACTARSIETEIEHQGSTYPATARVIPISRGCSVIRTSIARPCSRRSRPPATTRRRTSRRCKSSTKMIQSVSRSKAPRRRLCRLASHLRDLPEGNARRTPPDPRAREVRPRSEHHVSRSRATIRSGNARVRRRQPDVDRGLHVADAVRVSPTRILSCARPRRSRSRRAKGRTRRARSSPRSAKRSTATRTSPLGGLPSPTSTATCSPTSPSPPGRSAARMLARSCKRLRTPRRGRWPLGITYGQGLLALAFGRGEKPFAEAVRRNPRSVGHSKQFWVFNVNAHENPRRWNLREVRPSWRSSCGDQSGSRSRGIHARADARARR